MIRMKNKNYSNIRIYFDMDGIMAGYMPALHAAFGVPYKATSADYPYPLGSWHLLGTFRKRNGVSNRQFGKVVNDPEFWANLPILEDGMALLQDCIATFGKKSIYIATNPGKNYGAKIGKCQWLMKNIPEVSADKVYLLTDKYLLSTRESVLIDDCDENVANFENAVSTSKGKAFLYPRLWNKSYAKFDHPLNNKIIRAKLINHYS